MGGDAMNDLPVLWRPQLDTIYQFDALAFLRQMSAINR